MVRVLKFPRVTSVRTRLQRVATAGIPATSFLIKTHSLLCLHHGRRYSNVMATISCCQDLQIQQERQRSRLYGSCFKRHGSVISLYGLIRHPLPLLPLLQLLPTNYSSPLPRKILVPFILSKYGYILHDTWDGDVGRWVPV